jgi:small subunit ribosomal protein S19e
MPQLTVRDVDAHRFIAAYAKHLKGQGKIQPPKEIEYIKSGRHKQLAPEDPDWFYIRAASIARKIYLRPGTGVGALRRMYGGNYRRGTRKEHFSKSSGGIIRKILQALESNGVVEKYQDEECGGRQVTSSGRSDLDRIAAKVGPAPSILKA